MESSLPEYTTTMANQVSSCPAHPGHMVKYTRKLKLPKLPVFNQVKGCRAAMNGTANVIAFHQIMNNLTKMLTGEDWPISIVEMAHLLSFPQISESQDVPWNPFTTFLKECLSCDKDQYSQIRRESCVSGHHPNEFRQSGRCFQIGEFLKDKHDIAMLVMKYSMQPPTLHQTFDEVERDFKFLQKFDNMNEALQFGARQDFEYERIPTKVFNPRVYGCAFGNSVMAQHTLRASECKLFSRSFSNYGIAYTFNGISSDRLLHNTSDSQHQIGIFGMKPTHQSELHRVSPDTGSFNILQLTLQLSEAHIQPSFTTGDSEKEFRLALHNPDSLADLRNDYITLHAGKHHILKVEASAERAADGTLSMSEEIRGCLFPEETKGRLQLFQSYSKSACLLECNLKAVYRICGCLPWNYPHFEASLFHSEKPGLTELCDFEGNFCADRVLQIKSSDEECGCLPSCNKAIFTHRLTIEDIRVSKFCSPGKLHTAFMSSNNHSNIKETSTLP